MVPAEARPAGMGRFLRPLLSSAEVVVSTSMMSSVMPALACKQHMDRSSVSAGQVCFVSGQVHSVREQIYSFCGLSVYVTLYTLFPQGRGHIALCLYACICMQNVKVHAATAHAVGTCQLQQYDDSCVVYIRIEIDATRHTGGEHAANAYQLHANSAAAASAAEAVYPQCSCSLSKTAPHVR